MKTVELFNAVEAKPGSSWTIIPEYGVILEPSASHAKAEILDHLLAKSINGQELNATFHKSWSVIQNTPRATLLLHQLLHYLTTYGTGHTSDFVYTPNESLNIPERFRFVVIRGLSKYELIDKALNMLKSGVALKQETINSILSVLNEYEYEFDGSEEIKNKEVVMDLCKTFGVIPKDPVEQVRYLVYTATGSTLLIKDRKTLQDLKLNSNKPELEKVVLSLDAEKLATVFNRFKPLFLAIKNSKLTPFINRVSKLSKTLHKPMPYNILNNIGSCSLQQLVDQRERLMNANFYQLARCLQFLKQNVTATDKVYQIRNGKVFSKKGKALESFSSYSKIAFLIEIIKEKFPLDGLKVYIPDDVFYALPTSEKLFVGNVPFGSKFVADKLAMGVFWRNEGGARDIDLSALAINGKVGWNSTYDGGGLLYSGDMTYANPCATEYMYVNEDLDYDHMIMANIFSGLVPGSKFNIIVGRGDDINREYMMNPNNVWMTAATEAIKKESIIGIMTRDGDKNAAIVVNLAFGQLSVSTGSEKSTSLRDGLIQRWKNCFYLNDLLVECGATLVSEDECEVNLSPSKLQRDSIISLFAEKQ